MTVKPYKTNRGPNERNGERGREGLFSNAAEYGRLLAGGWANRIYTHAEDIFMTVATTVGPLKPSVRDDLAEYRDEHGYPSYNSALQAMLEEVADAE